MTEQVYRDLTPDLADVPCETWRDIDPQRLHEYMISRAPGGTPGEELSLRQLAGRVRAHRVSEATRQRPWLSRRLLALLDREFEEEDPAV
jgi:hypothetical protein